MVLVQFTGHDKSIRKNFNIHRIFRIYFCKVAVARCMVDISFFESMRIFRGDHGRVIFKLKLPKLCGGSSEEFNSLYSMLALGYAEVAAELSKTAEGDVRFVISFKTDEVIAKMAKKHGRGKTDEENCCAHILIRRIARLKIGNSEYLREALDEYDAMLGVFVK